MKISTFLKMRLFLCLFLGIFLISGCIPVFVGAGLVTGYALSNDTSASDVRARYHSLWKDCLKALKEMNAEILITNESRGLIKAKVYDSSLAIRINSINSRTQNLRVSARKYFLPKPRLAQKVFAKIIETTK